MSTASAASTQVTAPSAARSASPGTLAAGLPCGRRTPRGRLRWYVLSVPAGREAACCRALLRLLPKELLADAYAPRRERWARRAGEWRLERVPMHPGYIFAASPDAAALDRALRSVTTVPAALVGTEARSWAPLDDGAAAWFASMADGSRVVRASIGAIEHGALRVHAGPLAGREADVVKIDRHRRECRVAVGTGPGAFTEALALEVPAKS